MDPGAVICGVHSGQQRTHRVAGLPEPQDCWGRLPSFSDDSGSPSGKPGMISASHSVNTFRTHPKSTLSSSLSGSMNAEWARSLIILGC